VYQLTLSGRWRCSALQSPQLLQLSGIGPADLLRRHGIAAHVDAPEVGRNLQDHDQAARHRPDVLFNVMPLSVDKPGDLLRAFSGFSASQCRPDSRGTLEIRSADPLDSPRIVSNYLTEPRDIKTLVAGLELLREIYRQPAFRPARAGGPATARDRRRRDAGDGLHQNQRGRDHDRRAWRRARAGRGGGARIDRESATIHSRPRCFSRGRKFLK
jgi:choline dehydrogenase-like flavoprotein